MTADYPLKQKAEEVQVILDGAVLSNTSQSFSEETKAFIRTKIGASAEGEGIKIASHFDTLEELREAVPAPTLGAAYSVGSELPYELYIYDFYHGEWVNHGPIRSDDITARFAQDMAVPVGAWTQDTSVFADYTYRAPIALGEITGNDFPIVGFSPSDAANGNYAPLCFAFDGYVEIWAKAIPAGDISIPTITFIVRENAETADSSTKGVTNASGGIPTGGVSSAQLAAGSVTKAKLSTELSTLYIDCDVTAEWDGDAAPYTRQVAAEALLSTDRAVVRFKPPADFALLEEQQAAFALLYTAESSDGFITLYAKDKPESDFSVTLEVKRI